MITNLWMGKWCGQCRLFVFHSSVRFSLWKLISWAWLEKHGCTTGDAWHGSPLPAQSSCRSGERACSAVPHLASRSSNQRLDPTAMGKAPSPGAVGCAAELLSEGPPPQPGPAGPASVTPRERQSRAGQRREGRRKASKGRVRCESSQGRYGREAGVAAGRGTAAGGRTAPAGRGGRRDGPSAAGESRPWRWDVRGTAGKPAGPGGVASKAGSLRGRVRGWWCGATLVRGSRAETWREGNVEAAAVRRTRSCFSRRLWRSHSRRRTAMGTSGVACGCHPSARVAAVGLRAWQGPRLRGQPGAPRRLEGREARLPLPGEPLSGPGAAASALPAARALSPGRCRPSAWGERGAVRSRPEGARSAQPSCPFSPPRRIRMWREVPLSWPWVTFWRREGSGPGKCWGGRTGPLQNPAAEAQWYRGRRGQVKGLVCAVNSFTCSLGLAYVNLLDWAALEADQKEKVVKTLAPETKAFVLIVYVSDWGKGCKLLSTLQI